MMTSRPMTGVVSLRDPIDAPIVLISGAGGTLGRAIAAAVAGRDARLILTDRSMDDLSAWSDEVADRTLLSVPADLRQAAALDEIVSAVRDVGGLDAFVNSAGVEGPVGRAEAISAEAISDTFDVNVFAAFRMLGALVPALRRRGGGRIVNVASGAGLAGVGFLAAYSASKHALVGLTRSLAREVAPDGISVNAVCPGFIESPMMQRLESALAEIGPTSSAAYETMIPAGRYAKPSEIAEVVAYLALEAPTYLTGAAIPVDGGFRA